MLQNHSRDCFNIAFFKHQKQITSIRLSLFFKFAHTRSESFMFLPHFPMICDKFVCHVDTSAKHCFYSHIGSRTLKSFIVKLYLSLELIMYAFVIDLAAMIDVGAFSSMNFHHSIWKLFIRAMSFKNFIWSKHIGFVTSLNF